MPRTVSRSNEWKNLLKESITTGSLIISSNYEDKSDIKDKTLNSTTVLRSNQNGMDPSCEEETLENVSKSWQKAIQTDRSCQENTLEEGSMQR